MKVDIKLLDKDVVNYARHGILKVDLSDIDLLERDWHGAVLDLRQLNTISEPCLFWKRGTLRINYINHPTIYVASADFVEARDLAGSSKDPYSSRIPKEVRTLDLGKQLEGFQLITKGISDKLAFWDIQPVYMI